VNQATPLGLLINELITNACQHAFSEQNTGLITVTVELRNNEIFTEVKDNGKGIDDGIDIDNPNSLGFQLVSTLRDQLEADMTVHSDQTGTRITIKFAREEPRGSASNLNRTFN
jgi:two-component sensor histidine kinase